MVAVTSSGLSLVVVAEPALAAGYLSGDVRILGPRRVFLVPPAWGRPWASRCWLPASPTWSATHQDLGLVVDQTMNGLYNNYLLLAVPLFIFVANLMNASGVLERLLAFAQAMVGRFRGGLAHVNIVTNLIFSGMSGSAVADAAGPGLIVARMMTRDKRYPPGFAAATSVVAATLGPLVPPSIPMIFYALIANASVGALFLAGTVPAFGTAAALMGTIAVIARRRGFPAEKPPPWTECCRSSSARCRRWLCRASCSGSSIPALPARPRRPPIAAAYALLLALDLPLAHLRGFRRGPVRDGTANRRHRPDHVRCIRLQLCGGQRERAATAAQYPGGVAPVAGRLPALRQRAAVPARDRHRRDHHPAGDRAAARSGGGACTSTSCISGSWSCST